MSIQIASRVVPYTLSFESMLGEGVLQDYKKAREWDEKGASAGNGDAMFGLATKALR